jgi:AcrR family transcriptional regulator
MTTAVPASRRRGAALEDAILDAVWAELAEAGYQRLTLEGIAARARTSRPVLSRRWRSRAELVAAAAARDAPAEGDLPDTGDVRGDLVEVLRRLLHRLDAIPRHAFAPLLIEMMTNPELAPHYRALFAERLASLETILHRAAERGQIDPARLTPRLIRLPVDLLREEYLHPGPGPDDSVIAEIVDDITLPLLSVRGNSGGLRSG